MSGFSARLAVDIRYGLREGEVVVGEGSILLKPAAVESLQLAQQRP